MFQPIEIHLPAYPTNFIGRDAEIAEIAQRLRHPDCRLLTLVGPGGIGKTRLAIEVVKSAETATFANGIHFVDLQPISDSQLVVMTIANTLGMMLSGTETPRHQLLSYLRTRNMLLLIDNFEHLMDSLDLLTEIIKSAPGVKFLVTSREALNVQEEWLWQVGGLHVPDHQLPSNIESHSAVQLFAERARRARQDFSLSGQEQPVARICQLVEGTPLALELAASWVKVLTCAEIAIEIQKSIDFLMANVRNMPDRHRSMQAVFAHSWRLLTDEERAVFPRLSVFRGGFRREAAEQIAGASLAVLASLVDKSFLRVSDSGRYETHELMRQHGEEYLGAMPGARTDIQNRHCAYYADFLYQRQTALRQPQQARALDEIEDELDNIRVSWEWAVAQGMAHEIHRSMHSLYVFTHIRAQAAECERLFELAIKQFEHEDSATLAYLLLALIQLHWFNGRNIDYHQYLRAIRLTRLFWTTDEIAVPLRAYVWVRHDLISHKLYDDQQYVQFCHDFYEVCRIHGQPWGMAYMLFCLGDMLQHDGQYEEAERHFRQSMNDFLQMGDRWGSCWSSMGLAGVMESSQRHSEAIQLWDQHQVVCAEVGDRGGVVFALANKAEIAWRMQDYKSAKRYITQAIESHLEFGSQFAHLDGVLRLLTAVFISENRLERAAELSSFLRQQADSASAHGVRQAVHQFLQSLADKLPPEVYRQALERGKTMHLSTILEQLFEELTEYSPLAPSTSQTVPLSERELEVLRLLAAGRSNRQIAHDLVLTLNTVKSHIHHIYSKLGVESRTQAVARGRELHLL